MQIPQPFIPDETIMKGYSGGMALYVAHWSSVMTLFQLKCNEFVLRYEQFYSTPLN